MDQTYLKELIEEVNKRQGGVILNLDNSPSAVVLSIEKYNQLISNQQSANQQSAISESAISSSSFASNFADASLDKKAMEDKQQSANQTILVTGGAGYIGAHLVKQLLHAGYKVVVVDNLSTGKRENVPSQAIFLEGDLADVNFLRDVFSAHNISTVVHLSASIEVEESVKEPVKYFENNVLNSAKLLLVMDEFNVRKLIFSSTAAVYGEQKQQPISETALPKPNNPYGHSKLLAEQVIEYYCTHKQFTAVVFRYFNACGADFEGNIKATHESHLLAKVMQVAHGHVAQIVVNGADYHTPDGTCVRDYVHVLDIVGAHILALNKFGELKGFEVFNIGTGQGVSVLEIINATAEYLNKMIPMQMGERRAGDAEETVADAEKIKQYLGFKPMFSDLETIVKTAYKQSAN